ncbi:MAG: hypothetical protein HY295_01345 [Thaumarchaeota archaeon]|nr:hypothetical protein [Nitrososphaerota archaeon]
MEKPTKFEVNPDKEKKFLKILYPGVIAICVIIALLVQITVPQKNDIFNLTSLVIEISIGLLVTWTVFIYSKKWNKQNEKVTEDIKNLTENLNIITEEVRKTVIEESAIRKEIVYDISYHLNGHLKTIIQTLEHSLQMYDNCKNNKDGEAEHWFEVMKESYTRPQHFLDLRINLLDMMRIYGVNTARKYWRLLADLQTTNLLKDMPINQIDGVAKAIRESLNMATELKSIVEPFCTSTDK